MLASKPTAAEAAEVDVRADRRLGGILPYREKSVVAGNSKMKFTNASSCTNSPQGQLLLDVLKKHMKLDHIESK